MLAHKFLNARMILSGLLVFVVISGNAQGVFKCVDGSGKVEFRSTPCPPSAEQSTVNVSDPRFNPCERHTWRDSDHECLRAAAPRIEQLACEANRAPSHEQREASLRALDETLKASRRCSEQMSERVEEAVEYAKESLEQYKAALQRKERAESNR